MHRFLAEERNISQGKVVILDKKEVHHMKDVLRLRQGEEVEAFDGAGNGYNARVESLGREKVVLKIISRKKDRPKKWQICLCCALPKKSKFSFIVEKATELGADRVIPLKSSRTIVNLKPEREDKKIEHWRQVAINACKQSKGDRVPNIDKIFNFKQAVEESKKYDLVLIPHLNEKGRKIEKELMQFSGQSIMIFIGPEGDFTRQEIALAEKEKCIPVTLGDRVLKVDSAAFYVLSIINSIFHLRF